MTMSPFEVERREFGRSFMGYKAREVDAFVDEVRATLTQLWQERSDLREETERVNERLTRFTAMEEQLKNTLLLATDSAEKSTEHARREAELVLTEAGQKARDIVHQAHQEKARLEGSLGNLRAVEQETRQRFRGLAEAVLANLDESEAAAEESTITLRAAIREARPAGAGAAAASETADAAAGAEHSGPGITQRPAADSDTNDAAEVDEATAVETT